MRLPVALAVTLAFAAVPLAAQQQAAFPVQAGATLDRDSVRVGDVVRLVIRVRAPLGATINFPAAVDSLGPVQSIDPPVVTSGSDSTTAADRIATYRLAPWDVGLLPVRLGEVLVQTDAGERRIALQLPSLFVKSVLPADSTLRVPKPARALIVPPVPMPWWYWLAGALALLAILLLAWWIVRRRRGALLSSGDPYADARASFARVEAMRLVDAGEHGRYAVLMSDVLRRYLSERIAGVSLAQTSRELAEALRGSATVSAEDVGTLFNRVDPVKFARAPLGADRARELGEAAKEIVRDEHDRAEAIAAADAKQAKAA